MNSPEAFPNPHSVPGFIAQPIASPQPGSVVDFDRGKTLVQLKREKFGNPYWDFIPFPSGYHLRFVPLNQLAESDMLVLIRQSIGLDYLVWMALERLELDPLLKCRQRTGDLLSAVLLADALVWKRNPDYRARVTALWKKTAVRLVANQTPEVRMLFSDYRWFVKSALFLPAD